ncbi:MAG: acyl-CoA reductase [Chitinophagales bacterium]|nr:acyl-CoA reductase [Chitinophagales bacterium]
MNIEQRITAFSRLGDYILRNPIALQEVTHQSYRHHSWFTPESIAQSLKNIAAEFLSKEKLENWLVNYTIKQNNAPKTIAIVAAGNIPMVAFHDILCVLISGNKLQLKLSDKDKFLLPFLLERLIELESSFKTHISIQNRLENFDAIIATGSNSSAQHFEFYFGKYKNIIRRNRNSVAILNGTETAEELQQLGHDIFDYFGLGCRNVSKILIPNDFDLLKLKEAFNVFSNIMQHTQYMNNLDYQRTIYLMNQISMVDIDFINIVENKSLHSPISCLHYERYASEKDVQSYLETEKENIQCIIGKGFLPFGSSQQPTLTDYADNVDTLKFITSLN